MEQLSLSCVQAVLTVRRSRARNCITTAGRMAPKGLEAGDRAEAKDPVSVGRRLQERGCWLLEGCVPRCATVLGSGMGWVE